MIQCSCESDFSIQKRNLILVRVNVRTTYINFACIALKRKNPFQCDGLHFHFLKCVEHNISNVWCTTKEIFFRQVHKIFSIHTTEICSMFLVLSIFVCLKESLNFFCCSLFERLKKKRRRKKKIQQKLNSSIVLTNLSRPPCNNLVKQNSSKSIILYKIFEFLFRHNYK